MGTDSKKARSRGSCFFKASRMAPRQAFAVMMARGREFWRIQATSSLVRAGETRVAVSPAARVPSSTGAKARELGTWMRTTGAISGP